MQANICFEGCGKMDHSALIRVSGLQVIYIGQGNKGGPGPWLIQSIPMARATCLTAEINSRIVPF
jgi:hypothetical protein